MCEAFPEGVGGDRDAASVLDLDVDLDVAEHVAGDGHIAFAGRRTAAAADEGLVLAGAEDADVRRARRLVGMLDGTASDGDFADGAASGVEFDVGGRLTFRVVVTLDVAGADLDVPDVAAAGDDAAPAVVADVRTDNVRLVQVDVIVEDPDA